MSLPINTLCALQLGGDVERYTYTASSSSSGCDAPVAGFSPDCKWAHTHAEQRKQRYDECWVKKGAGAKSWYQWDATSWPGGYDEHCKWAIRKASEAESGEYEGKDSYECGKDNWWFKPPPPPSRSHTRSTTGSHSATSTASASGTGTPSASPSGTPSSSRTGTLSSSGTASATGTATIPDPCGGGV